MFEFSWLAATEISGIALTFAGVGFAYGMVQSSMSSLVFRTTGD